MSGPAARGLEDAGSILGLPLDATTAEDLETSQERRRVPGAEDAAQVPGRPRRPCQHDN